MCLFFVCLICLVVDDGLFWFDLLNFFFEL